MRGSLELMSPSTTRLALWDKAQRFESSRALVVVFEQEPIDFERSKQFFGNSVVAAFGIPMAAVVPAAEMHAEDDAVAAGGAQASIVCPQRFIERGVWVGFEIRSNPGTPLWVEVIAVAWRIDLDIRHPFGRQLRQIRLHDLYNIPK